tara:strand:- start:465 stop:752 length:288 start_codon:yes stop_codon:yes gene_type:complete
MQGHEQNAMSGHHQMMMDMPMMTDHEQSSAHLTDSISSTDCNCDCTCDYCSVSTLAMLGKNLNEAVNSFCVKSFQLKTNLSSSFPETLFRPPIFA